MPKKKPCQWCEGEHWQNEYGNTDGHYCSVEVYPDSNFLAVTSYAKTPSDGTDEIPLNFPMNYCPNCGRKLI